MSDKPEIRVEWTVVLYAPSGLSLQTVAGMGATPTEAAIALRNNLHAKADLVDAFGRTAVKLP